METQRQRDKTRLVEVMAHGALRGPGGPKIADSARQIRDTSPALATQRRATVAVLGTACADSLDAGLIGAIAARRAAWRLRIAAASPAIGSRGARVTAGAAGITAR
jgi:hypothetical protein